MAAITLALLFACVFLVINKQEQLSVITNEVQTYMGQRDTLQKEVGDLQRHRDRRAALDKEWEEFKTREIELKGKYGEKLALERECAKLTERRDGLRNSVKAQEELVSSLERRIAELASQTNFLGKMMNRMCGERDAILADTKADMETQDKVKALRVAEEGRYTEQKRLADQESERAYSEKKRADEAKIAADEAERRKEDAERAAKAAETVQKARVAALRAETDKEVAAQEKRASAARKAAADASAKAEAEEARLKTLATEVAKLEARRDELAGVEKQLDETKEALAEEQAKLGQTRAKVSAQQVTAQIDGVREDVTKRLDAFKAKLDELEKKQNAEVKQGGLE
jgi:chromosome segregation ATPase